MYVFDEYDAYYRSPGGAIESGRSLLLRLRVRRNECKNAHLIIKADGGPETESAMKWTGVSGVFDIFELETEPLSTALYWYRFRIDTGSEQLYIGCSGISNRPDSNYQVTVYEKGLRTPEWFLGGIMYHIFVDRFYRSTNAPPPNLREGSIYRTDWGEQPVFRPDEKGIVRNNDFFGGDLEGIIEKLPYLEKLGVTCIYLSPVFRAESNHKYDTGDFMNIDPGFGSNQIFTRLCEKARKRGMRVILDGVFDHVGEDSIYFNKYGKYKSIGAYQSEASPYHKWFNFINWEERVYESWWGIQLLPQLNKNNTELHEYIAGENGVIETWEERGASGWRLDVVDELPDVFLDRIVSAAKKKKEDALIIGEVWEDASNKIAYGVRRRYLLGGQLDSVMNYPLKDGIVAYVKDKDAEKLARTMGELTQNYPRPILNSLMNILGTHDTARILTVLGSGELPQSREEMSKYTLTAEELTEGKKLLKIAALLQYTLPGVPCVYYGDEAGMQGGADPFNRACYPWEREDRGLLSWYRKLARIRKKLGVLAEGVYELQCARDGLYAFTRGEGKKRVMIVANVSDSDVIPDMAITKDYSYEVLGGLKVNNCRIAKKSAAIFTQSAI